MKQTYSNYGAGERIRRAAKEAEHRRNMMLGLILAPTFLLGWLPIVWVFSKIFK
jgi:hypothetical protein